MRDAINWLIERLGLSYPQFPRPENEMVRLWLKLLEDNLCHRDVNIRRGAAESLSSIGVYFGDSKSTDDFTELRDQMVSSFTKVFRSGKTVCYSDCFFMVFSGTYRCAN